MASSICKITRSLDLLKAFLKYNKDEYYETYIEVKPGKGWSFGKHSDKIFSIVSNLYGNLYEGIAPLISSSNTASDKQIVDKLKSLKEYVNKDLEWFQEVYFIDKEFFGNPIVGDVYSLVENAFYKLEEVLEIANEDLSRNQTAKTEKEKTAAKPQKTNNLIGIVTTTDKEFQGLKALLKDVAAEKNKDFDCNIYYSGYYENDNNQKVNVIFTKSQFQGIAFAASTTTKLILKYKPKYIAMLGYAAGNPNLMSELSIGDILICLTAVDYNQTEIRQRKPVSSDVVPQKDGNKQKETLPESKNEDKLGHIEIIDRKIPYHSNGYIFGKANEFSYDEAVLNKVKKAFKNETYFKSDLRAFTGKFITGSALVRSKEEIDKLLKQNSGTIALDMETYGFYVACENSISENKPMCIAVKSISDFGTHEDKYLKNPDKYTKEAENAKVRQEYAAHTSAMFFLEFAVNHLVSN